MDTALKTLLETRAASVNDIVETLGRSATWVRTQLKNHEDIVLEAPSVLNFRTTLYYLPAPQEPAGEPLEDALDFAPAALLEDPAHEIDETRCRFCQSTNISAGGEIGSFLGAATVCGDCSKTYNTFSGEEITPSATAGVKKKRQPLNPQYKIRAKAEAVQAAGGNLSFDKEARQWTLVSPSGLLFLYTALEFSAHTPETLVALLGEG